MTALFKNLMLYTAFCIRLALSNRERLVSSKEYIKIDHGSMICYMNIL